MSAAAENESDDDKMLCASCGIAGIDDIKLKDCGDCDLVRYCSDECQEDHWPQHEEECKQRAAELHDEILFKQPESSHLGDCPLCCLPHPIDLQKSGLYTCCNKRVCDGCNFANRRRETERRLEQKCPFCRTAAAKTKEESNERLMKRAEANDPVAMRNMGTDRYDEGDYTAAFEYWTRAAALGDVPAHFQLSTLYGEGEGVEKDEKKELHHLTVAAIAGHPAARYNLGYMDMKNNQVVRAVKHFIIAAKLGHDQALAALKNLYKDGFVSKDDFAAALRGHHAANKATESPQRKEAADFYDNP